METGMIVTKSEISKVSDNVLNTAQMKFLFQRTPAKFIKERPAKGGGVWRYVSGTYVKKVLNLMFGWDWSFEVKEHKFDLMIGQAFVLGRLTVHSNGRTIVKEQFGRVDIKFKKEPDSNGNRIPLDLGNDLKAATSDALKKCSAELGIAADVYSPMDYVEINVVDDQTNEEKAYEIQSYLNDENFVIGDEDRIIAEQIISEKEIESYDKVLKKFRKAKAAKP